MKRLTLRIKPLQPLMLRGPGEFDPTSRGVYAYATSLHVPWPSTIVGLIAFTAIAMNIIRTASNTDTSSWDRLLKYYENLLYSLGIKAIRGPYFYDAIKDKLYIPLLMGKELFIVDHDQARHYLCEGRVDIINRYLSGRFDQDFLEDVKEVVEKLKAEATLNVKRDHRIGIGLKTRSTDEYPSTKTVKSGLIYEAWFTSYPLSVEIRVKLVVKDHGALADTLTSIRTPIRFGGEQRIALAAIDET